MSRRNEVLGGREGVGDRADDDVEISSRLGRPARKARAAVSSTTGRAQELGVSSRGNVDESGAGVNDGRGGALQRGGAVGQARCVNAPVAKES